MITYFYQKIQPVLITVFGLLITIIPKVNGQSNEGQVDLDSNPQKFSQLRHPMEGDPGFFIDDWTEKKNPKISYSKTPLSESRPTTVHAVIDYSTPLVKVSKYIFGNNLGHWTNRKMLANDDFIFNLKDISIPVIRFPGGNASNDYFWDAGSLDQCPEAPQVSFINRNLKKQRHPNLGQIVPTGLDLKIIMNCF